MIKDIIKSLPGYNCGKCGCSRCDDFAEELLRNNKKILDCSVLSFEEFKDNRLNIEKVLENNPNTIAYNEKIIGLIDSYQADITLDPIDGSNSCTEVLLPTSNHKLRINDIVKYRPLGCPIIHFARIVEINGLLLSVHIIGPENRITNSVDKSIDIGPCIIIAFHGKYKGKNIKVGETIRFLPSHCMMQKVHSGVVVNIENNNVIIEGIDLKVWDTPKTY
ncbi:MAG: hypothetical protein JXA53_06220 [Bacteroidales bacterium]|nr:hypothetical protein [Bacteroidales bacterium]